MKRGKSLERPVIDTDEFTRKAGRTGGECPLAALERLDDLLTDHEGGVRWQLAGERTRRPDQGFDAHLALSFSGAVRMRCVRCLEPVTIELDQHHDYRLVASESIAARDDAEHEDLDLLVASRALDVMELLQDEVIMALPFAPRHATCVLAVADAGGDRAVMPEAAPSSPAPDGDKQRPNPFAVLASLRRPGK